MNTMGLIAGLRDLRTRLIAVSLIVGILAMQYPLPALALPAENRCVSPTASKTCVRDPQNQNDQIETYCGHTSDSSMAYAGGTDEDCPDSGPCRLNNCEPCALPCCDGEPLAPFLSEIAAAHTVVTSDVFSADGAPLLSGPTKIFHPPRI